MANCPLPQNPNAVKNLSQSVDEFWDVVELARVPVFDEKKNL
jgi:hypothetical protein